MNEYEIDAIVGAIEKLTEAVQQIVERMKYR